MLHIYVDADACPVKPEVFRVAERLDLEVTLVANSWMRVEPQPWLTLEVVPGGYEAADDWIVEQVQENDIVVTADILLAERCLKKGARVLGFGGIPFTADNIGQAVAMRNLMADLREAGQQTRGPKPLTKKDRSQFLQQLDNIIRTVRREQEEG